jgi:hypothetical protein
MVAAMHGSTTRLLAVAVSAISLAGCVSAEDSFIGGREEILCLSGYPVCAAIAGCEITRDTYVVTSFPGNQQFIFRSGEADAIVRVALFFRTERFPGSEVLVRLHTPDCGDYEEAQTFSDDPFEEAGDDRTLEFDLDAGGEGTHLLEVFSDATATALIRAEIVGSGE